MEYVISKAAIEKIMSYLANKPFIEVADLMKMLTTLKQVKEKEESK
jgi:hypothetical protein